MKGNNITFLNTECQKISRTPVRHSIHMRLYFFTVLDAVNNHIFFNRTNGNQEVEVRRVDKQREQERSPITSLWYKPELLEKYSDREDPTVESGTCWAEQTKRGIF